VTRPQALGFVVAALVAAGIAVDQVSPAVPPPPVQVAPLSSGGVWGCPFVYAGNGRAWLHLANAGTDPSVVRVSFVRDRARRIVQEVRLGPGQAATLPADTRLGRASGAIVEYAGGEVFASRTAVFDAPVGLSAARRGAVGAPCSRAGEETIVAPSSSTLAAETTLVLLNPSSSDALVDVSFAEGGDEFTPEKLSRVVVPARGRRQFRAGDFAFDVRALAIIVRVRSGRVVADALVATSSGLVLSPGRPPSPSLVAIASTSGGSARVDVAALGDQDAIVAATSLSPAGRTALEALAGEVPADAPVVAGLGPAKAAAVAASLALREGPGLVATAVWAVGSAAGRGDFAASEARPPARRIVAVAGPPAVSQQMRLLVANPNDGDATFSVTILTAGGPVSAPGLTDVRLAAGRTTALSLPPAAGTLGAALVSDLAVGMTLAATVAGSRDAVAFGIAGVEVSRSPPVGITLDQRLGVPGP
jgi:hypothetical protein